jgi:Flp pilus assembly protein TadG
MFLMLFGALDFGRAMHSASVVASSARSGAQYGVQSLPNSGNETGIQTAARNDAYGNTSLGVTSRRFCTCQIGGSEVGCNANCGATIPQIYVEVQTTLPFQTVLAYPTLPNPMTLRGAARMRVR